MRPRPLSIVDATRPRSNAEQRTQPAGSDGGKRFAVTLALACGALVTACRTDYTGLGPVDGGAPPTGRRDGAAVGSGGAAAGAGGTSVIGSGGAAVIGSGGAGGRASGTGGLFGPPATGGSGGIIGSPGTGGAGTGGAADGSGGGPGTGGAAPEGTGGARGTGGTVGSGGRGTGGAPGTGGSPGTGGRPNVGTCRGFGGFECAASNQFCELPPGSCGASWGCSPPRCARCFPGQPRKPCTATISCSRRAPRG